MYGKIFDSMYEGTLYGHWEAIVTLQQMLVLCSQDGMLDMTPQAIAARTSIPLDIITKGIGILSEPDPYTRTPGEDGKRIILMDAHRPWGWLIVNYAKYRDMVNRAQKNEADRVRIADRRKVIKDSRVAGCSETSPSVATVADVAHASVPVPVPASAEASDSKTLASSAEKPRSTPCVVGFDFAKGQFTAITGVDHERWGNAYPAIDVPREIAAAAAWLVANPKNRKSNYQRFLVNWFGRAQDRAPRAGGAVLPTADKPWWLTAPGIEAKGAELAVDRGDDAFPHFKARVFEAAGTGPWNESQTAARVLGEAQRRAAA